LTAPPSSEAPRVVVVGAGLTGLVVAFRLAARGAAVVLVERDARTGGQIHTVREAGVVVELGAEGFVARSESVPRLCRDLGIESELIDQATTLTYALEDSELVELAPGEAAKILGFQVPREELGRGIRSMRLGMGQLIETLSATIDGRVSRRHDEVRRLSPSPEGVVVELGSGAQLTAAAVVVATPASRATQLVADAAGGAAAGLGQGALLSNASATLLYDASQLGRPLNGSGFIVPARAQTSGFRACSFVTLKFNRPVPDGTVLLRAFFRPTPEDLAGRDIPGWIDLAVASVSGPLHLSGPPRRAWASMWPNALPVYDEGYREAVARAETALEPHGIFLAGSHFHGAGIDAAVVSAEAVADRISSRLGLEPPAPR
jgi:oxygen-dependent protoporphyrinogen oxidase